MATNTFCVALTGGIASGKSTVSVLFEAFGTPIIDTDKISHALTDIDTPVYQAICAHFGKTICNNDRHLNRLRLRDIIFNCPEEKKWLEQLLHPLIRIEAETRVKAICAPYCICVIPLLAESQAYRFVQRVLVVDAPREIQIARAMQRDHMSQTLVLKILDAQAKRENRNKLADDLIVNNDDISALRIQVSALHASYLKLAEIEK